VSRARDLADAGSKANFLDAVTANIPSDVQTALDAKLATTTASSTYAPKASPTFTGTVSGVTPAHLGLGVTDISSDVTTTSIANSWLNHHFYKFGDFVFVNFSIYGASATFSVSDEHLGTIGTTANIPSYNAHFPTSSHQGDTALAVRIKGTNNTDGTAGQIRLISMVEQGVDTNIHVLINGFYKV